MSEHEHIEPGDPRYEGFRITEVWLLCFVDAEDNQEGIMLMSPQDAMRHSHNAPLAIATDPRRADHLRDFAKEWAGKGETTTLKHFVLDREDRYEHPGSAGRRHPA